MIGGCRYYCSCKQTGVQVLQTTSTISCATPLLGTSRRGTLQQTGMFLPWGIDKNTQVLPRLEYVGVARQIDPSLPMQQQKRLLLLLARGHVDTTWPPRKSGWVEIATRENHLLRIAWDSRELILGWLHSCWGNGPIKWDTLLRVYGFKLFVILSASFDFSLSQRRAFMKYRSFPER